MQVRRGGPSWLWWLAGLLAYLCAPRPTWAPPPLVSEDLQRWRPRSDVAEMPVRDLRRIPSLGNRRATATVEARWRLAVGESLRWTDVPGIGEITAERVRAHLAEQGMPTDPTPRSRSR